jgi:hypothetical protein
LTDNRYQKEEEMLRQEVYKMLSQKEEEMLREEV